MKYIITVALVVAPVLAFAGPYAANRVSEAFYYVDTNNMNGKVYKIEDEKGKVNCYLFIANGPYRKSNMSCVTLSE